MSVRETTNGYIPVFDVHKIVVASGTSAEEYITDLPSSYRRYLAAAYFVSNGDGAGGGATRLFRVIKNTSTVAASKDITLALADSGSPKGLVTAFTNGTKDARTFDSGDTITIDVTGAGTSFSTLTGTIKLVWLFRPQQVTP
jgi:hypothetical protein